MDHTSILNKIRDDKNLELAFHYAFHDRTQKDYYLASGTLPRLITHLRAYS